MEDNKIEIIEGLDENLMDHEYDGIRELDNSLPPWWLYMFYGTIIFAVLYMGNYFFMGAPSQEEEYVAEMQIAGEQLEKVREEKGGSVGESNVGLMTEDENLEHGESIYIKNCLACHGANGEGGIGPNLTDEYWISGGTINEVFRTIKYGVPEKGMIPWESQLSPEQIQQVSSYILVKLLGTDPPNAKEPQGDRS